MKIEAKEYAKYLLKHLGSKDTAMFVVRELEHFYDSQFVLEGSNTQKYFQLVREEIDFIKLKQREAIVQMMRDAEELGLYDTGKESKQ